MMKIGKISLVVILLGFLSIVLRHPTISAPGCTVPDSGDWLIATSCDLIEDTYFANNITIGSGVVFTIKANVTLTINFNTKKITVLDGGELFIESGGKVSSMLLPPTEQNLRVAFIGDSGYGANFSEVLTLIHNEGAEIVIHNGDFDYQDDPGGFEAVINSVLGENYPYFIAIGNHDLDSWSGYADYALARMQRLGITPDSSDLSDEMYGVTYKGLKMLFVGLNGVSQPEFGEFINSQLLHDNHLWRICNWHQNMTAMQLGDKTDEMGWDVYENCRLYGAIVATAHHHSYHRTKTLSDMSDQTVDATCSERNELCVSEGKTFAFISGLGGYSKYSQSRCLPDTYPYGCNNEWAYAYTTNQNSQYGVLFIDFYVNGDSRTASGYFKNINGEVIDTFTITNDR